MAGSWFTILGSMFFPSYLNVLQIASIGKCIYFIAHVEQISLTGAIKVLIDQLILDGIVYQFCVVFHVHFFKNAGTIGADGFDTQREFICDFRDRFA